GDSSDTRERRQLCFTVGLEFNDSGQKRSTDDARRNGILHPLPLHRLRGCLPG
ncbi:MAG: hypothetical protein RL109_626, partial [Pseudomonadota bacterium]